MKVFATSDLHGELEGLDFTGCDLAVIAGDIAPLRSIDRKGIRRQTNWVNREFREFTDSFKDVQFAITPGNHDFFPIAKDMFDGDWEFAFGPNVKFLLDEAFEFKGLNIYGTPRIPIISRRWAFESEHDELVRRFSEIPDGLDILISHSPPRIVGEDVDFSLQTLNGPFGSTELAQAIASKRPKMVFCGHIHSGDHSPVEFGGSVVTNVSRLDEMYEVRYDVFKTDVGAAE